MKTMSVVSAIDWCKQHEIELDERERPRHPDKAFHCIRCGVPKLLERLTWFCRFVEGKLQPHQQCLLWITDWGIWESSENWHLYYRLRQGYGDFQLIEEAPGHLFQDYETPDLITFLEVGVISGWDMHLCPTNGYGRAFISHDGWIDFALKDSPAIREISMELGSP